MISFCYSSQISTDNGVKVLVYGPAGVGKTMLVATLPAPVLISAESGLLSLRRNNIEKVFGSNVKGICYDIPVITIQSYEDLEQVLSWCRTSAEAKNFQSIGLDSVSEIAEVILSRAKVKNRDPRHSYLEMQEKTEDAIRNFRDLPGKNVYMSAKMEPNKDELTGVVKYGPSLPGSKMGNKMPYFFDEVFRLGLMKDQAGKTHRFLQTQPDMQYDAKDRSGALEPYEFPSFQTIFWKITGKSPVTSP